MDLEEEKCFTNFLELNAEKASILDLFRIVFSSRLHEREFFNIPDARIFRAVKNRWLIFTSMLLQKILIWLRKPMFWTGWLLEAFMNLLNNNGGLLRLPIRALTGRLVLPDTQSENFTSVVGNLDTRFNWDESIQFRDPRFYSYLAMMATKLTYENEAFNRAAVTGRWQMEFIGYHSFWNDYLQNYDTLAILFRDKVSNTIVLAFRGTRPFDANGWRTDVDISWFQIQGVGKAHSGFMKALGLQRQTGCPKDLPNHSHPPYAYYELRDKLKDLLGKNKGAKLVVTGHSLGAALAIVFTSVLAIHDESTLLDSLQGVYTFGQPRVGDKKFGKYVLEKFRKYNVRYLRYVYCNDLVPRVPFDNSTLLFKHFGSCLFYDSIYKGQVLPNEPNKNYFSIWMVIPYLVNAIWELARGFVLVIRWGREYEEGWATITLRLIGLLIPGVSAHFPQDYINLLRLGPMFYSVPVDKEGSDHVWVKHD